MLITHPCSCLVYVNAEAISFEPAVITQSDSSPSLTITQVMKKTYLSLYQHWAANKGRTVALSLLHTHRSAYTVYNVIVDFLNVLIYFKEYIQYPV